MTAVQNRERVADEIEALWEAHFFQFRRRIAVRLMKMTEAELGPVMAMQADGDALGALARALRRGEITIEAAQAEAKRLMKALPALDAEGLADLARSRALRDMLAGVDADPDTPDPDTPDAPEDPDDGGAADASGQAS